jgi:hypothetical protein
MFAKFEKIILPRSGVEIAEQKNCKTEKFKTEKVQIGINTKRCTYIRLT